MMEMTNQATLMTLLTIGIETSCSCFNHVAPFIVNANHGIV
jgi:hypothetical protein